MHRAVRCPQFHFVMIKHDPKFTEKLRKWLDNEERDYAQGAMMLYQLRANPVEFRRISADPNGYAEYIFSQIKRFFDFRTSGISHQEVEKKVFRAVRAAENVAVLEHNEKVRSGKRADHDSLPEEIRLCYEQNLLLMRRIADLHTKIRLIIQSKAACKDADLLPFASEIISLDKQRLANWKRYDSFKAE